MIRVLVGFLVLSLLVPPVPLQATVPSTPSVRLSEISTDPQHDWSTNSFDGTPGSGSITGSDEYIEIANVGSLPVDLTGWRVETSDSSTDADEIDLSLVKNEGPDETVATFPAGAYWILGNPVGEMNNDVQVRLLDADGAVVDQVTLGDFDDEDVLDNAPSGNATDASDEAVARDDAVTDADQDADDWRHGAETMGQANGAFPSDEPEEDEPPADDPPPSDNPSDPGDTDPVDPWTFDRSAAMRLSELFPDPLEDEQEEFIELVNTGARAVDLAGWEVSDASRTYAFPTVRGRTVIPARGFLVLDRATTSLALNNSGGESVTLLDPDERQVDRVAYTGTTRTAWSYARMDTTWVWTSTVTPGAANRVVNQAPVLTVDFPSRGRVGVPVEGSASTDDADGDAITVTWTFGDGSRSTHGEDITHAFAKPATYRIRVQATDERGAVTEQTHAVVITAYDRTATVRLSELLPSPDGDDASGEWVEVVNTGGAAVDIAGWQLTNERTTYTIPEGVRIGAHGFHVFEREETGIALRNTAENVFLIDPAGTVLHGVSYTRPPVGSSWSFQSDGSWVWTTALTPGAANAAGDAIETDTLATDARSDARTVSIAGARTTTAGSVVTVTGTVAAPPGVFADRVGYLGDGESGVSFSVPAGAAALVAGDVVTLTGRVAHLVSGVRLRIQEVGAVIRTGRGPVSPRDLVPGASLDASADQFVRVTGTIAQRRARTLSVRTDDGQTVPVSVRTALPVDLKRFGVGRTVTVTGIVISRDGTYRLMPRDEHDLQLAGDGEVAGATTVETDSTAATPGQSIDLSSGAPSSSSRGWYVLLGGIAAASAIAYGVRRWWERRRGQKPSSVPV